jgi:hypothetical protein
MPGVRNGPGRFSRHTRWFKGVRHACVFFAHEYAHTFTAWLLGWKSNPLALHYPAPTLVVLLLQIGIDQNVDEGPIFASGHGAHAAIIGAAGAILGNALISYPLSRWGYAQARHIGSRAWAMFAYWATVANVGNFIDYVPIRTFTTGGDMGSIQRGFGWSPWTILVCPRNSDLAGRHVLLRPDPARDADVAFSRVRRKAVGPRGS